MTKRIIGLILVVVMLALSLVGCGYSFAKDDLSAYATLSDEKKTELLEKIKKITIEDGSFSPLDPAKREEQVLDSVYAALANAATKDQKKEGVPAARDLVYYCYYATADFDGTESVFYASNMKQTSAVSLQLGKSDLEGIAAKVADLLKSYDFKNGTYSSTLSGKTKEGQKAYVTYTYTYTPEGATAPVTSNRENALIQIGAAVTEGEPTSFESYLCDKDIAKKITESKTINNVTYSNVTINWVANGEPIGTVKDVTYTEEKFVTDTTKASKDLNGKELTYYIYPVYYVSVPEYNATNIVSILLGENITDDALYEMILGKEWANLDEEEDAEKIEERAELLANYKTEEDKLSIEDLVDKIIKTYTEAEELEKSLEDSQENLSDLELAVAEAQSKYDEAEEPSEELQKALDDAKKAVEQAKENIEKTNSLIKEKATDRENYTTALLGITVEGVTVETKLVNGYKVVAYDYLQDAYNTEIKMKLAKEIYFFLEKEIEVTDVPEKAVKLSYDRLVENYEYDFYTGSDTTSKETYYKAYKGSFKNFLKESVNTKYSGEYGKVETYDEALDVLEKVAKTYVEPIVRIYVAAKAFDVLATDKEFKEYTKDTDNNYSYNEYYYGENSVRYAHQFDKLMNYFLAYDEVKAEKADDNGYISIVFDYKLIEEIIDGEPESEKKTEEKAEEKAE